MRLGFVDIPLLVEEIPNNLGYEKNLVKNGINLSIKWCRISSINSMIPPEVNGIFRAPFGGPVIPNLRPSVFVGRLGESNHLLKCLDV